MQNRYHLLDRGSGDVLAACEENVAAAHISLSDIDLTELDQLVDSA